MTAVKSVNADHYIEQAKAFQSRSVVPQWLKRFRSDALESLIATGFPSAKHEEWRYTNLAPVTGGAFRRKESAEDVPPETLEPYFLDDSWTQLVFVDGEYRSDLSRINGLEKGLQVYSLREAWDQAESWLGKALAADYSPFSALNSSVVSDGALVIALDTHTDGSPVQLLYVAGRSGYQAIYPRNLIIAGKSSVLTVIERFVSLDADTYFCNAVTEVIADEGASVELYRIQQESPKACHISAVGVGQKTGSKVFCASVNLGGRLTRNDISVVLDGSHCHTTLNGLSIMDGERHVDNHTSIDHAQPDCESHELYKAIVDDRARSVFNGKIYVRPGAQRTDAKQTNRNLLLSKDATVDTKPQLEIFADDVKCTHGATIGQLNEDEIFYLRSRGMSQEVATQLLTYGFANDIVEKIKPQALRTYLDEVQLSALHTTSEFRSLHDDISA